MAHAPSDAGAGDQDCQGRGLVCFTLPCLGFGLQFCGNVQGEKRQFLPILTGDSLDAQHATTAHFGLGKTDSIDALQVRWPDGNITRLEKPAVDSYYVIRP